jgi:hypothetical protein
VFQEQMFYTTVLGHPIERGAGKGIHLSEDAGATVAQAVDKVPGPGLVEIRELGGGPVEIAVVKEELQPSQDLLGAATYEPGEVRGGQESVPRHLADDFDVPCREPDGPSRFRGTAEAWQSSVFMGHE